MININVCKTSKAEEVNKEIIDEEKRYKELKWKYELLIKARNFHYENFNKWMTYFFLIISALIVGLCNILTKQNGSFIGTQKYVVLIICSLGFIVSLAWHWANKGYYYWNINFITLVNYYEKNLLKFAENERVYLVFANKKEQNHIFSPIAGANFSTSKISILLSYIITLFWGSIICFILFNNILQYDKVGFLIRSMYPSLFTILIINFFAFIAQKFLFSKNQHFPDLEVKFPKWKKTNNNI